MQIKHPQCSIKWINHEHFRCFTQNIVHFPKANISNYLYIFERIIGCISTKYLEPIYQSKSIYKKNAEKLSFSCYCARTLNSNSSSNYVWLFSFTFDVFSLLKKSVKYFLLFLIGLIFCLLLFFGKNQLPDYVH